MSEISFLETELAKIKAEMKKDYEIYSGKTLYEGSREAIFIDWLAYWIWHGNCSINEFGRQNFSKYATGENLDAVIENIYGIERQKEAKAEVLIRFYVKEGTEQIVPKGTIVTSDGNVSWQTEKTLFIDGTAIEIPEIPEEIPEIPVEVLSTEKEPLYVYNSGIVKAVCTQNGSIGNGIAAFTKMAFTRLPNVVRAETIVESSGGRERESDEEYLLRAEEESRGYSTAGPYEAYEYLARKANRSVVDAKAVLQDGEIIVYISLKQGTADKEAVAKYCEDYIEGSGKKPQDDIVRCAAQEPISYNVDVFYTLSKENISRRKEIEETFAEAVKAFSNKNDNKFGRPLNPTQLAALLYEAGAEYVEIRSPQYIPNASGELTFEFSGVADYECGT